MDEVRMYLTLFDSGERRVYVTDRENFLLEDEPSPGSIDSRKTVLVDARRVNPFAKKRVDACFRANHVSEYDINPIRIGARVIALPYNPDFNLAVIPHPVKPESLPLLKYTKFFTGAEYAKHWRDLQEAKKRYADDVGAIRKKYEALMKREIADEHGPGPSYTYLFSDSDCGF